MLHQHKACASSLPALHCQRLGADKCPARGFKSMLSLAVCTKGSLIYLWGLGIISAFYCCLMLSFPLQGCSLKSLYSCHGVVLPGQQ